MTKPVAAILGWNYLPNVSDSLGKKQLGDYTN